MGTNYYRYNLPTEEQIKEMHRLVDKLGNIKDSNAQDLGGSLEDISQDLKQLISSSIHRVHICKCSYGWKTLFNHHWGEFYQLNRKSLDEFLREPGTILCDEYGELITPDAFWAMVDKRDNCTYPDGTKPLTGKNVRTNNNQDLFLFRTHDAKRCAQLFGIPEPKDYDFMSDGLRFSVQCDFS